MGFTKSSATAAIFLSQALMANAAQVIGAPVAPNLLTRPNSLLARQAISATSRFSPSTTSILIPIATACPTVAAAYDSKEAFHVILLPNTTNFTGFMVKATAVLADGGSTTFASRMKRSTNLAATTELSTLPDGLEVMPNNDDEDVGHIFVGRDGCQTLFMPTTTAICSTVITPAALPAVTVTDCDQYITFSSENLSACAPTAEAMPSSAASSVALNAGSSTTRSFSANDTYQDATSTYTPTADSNDDENMPTSTPTSEVSGANEGNENENLDVFSKRQIMLERNGKPKTTDLATIAPNMHSAGKRQVSVFKGKAVITDLANVAPPRRYPESPAKRQILNSKGKVIMTDLLTVVPPLPTRTTSAMMRASGVPPINGAEVGLIANKTSSLRVEVSGEAVTKIMPIPDILHSEYKRDHTMLHHHRSVDGAEPTPTRFDPNFNITDGTLNGIYANLILHAGLSKGPMRLANTETFDFNARVANLSPPRPTKYYAAHWSELANGGVPTHVKGITCRGGLVPLGECTVPDTDGDTETCECEVEEQSWSVSTMTLTRTGTTIASFDGPAVITWGQYTKTTSISFTTVLSTTQTFLSELILKSTLSVSDDTVTQTFTSIPSATISLLPGETDAAANPEVEVKAAAAGAPQDAPTSITSTMAAEGPSVMPAPAIDDFTFSATTTPDGALPTATDAPGIADYLPTTVFETSTVTTETVTVDPTPEATDAAAPISARGASDVSILPISYSMSDDVALPTATEVLAAPAMERRDGWLKDIWALHMP